MSILIVLVILGIAVPSLSGVLAERRLRASYDEFAGLAADAQRRSVVENRTYLLVWDGDGRVRLLAADLPVKSRPEVVPASLPAGARYALLLRPAGDNDGDAATEWAFFPTGNCEPARVRCEAPAGTWEAVFNPLTIHGTFSNFAPR